MDACSWVQRAPRALQIAAPFLYEEEEEKNSSRSFAVVDCDFSLFNKNLPQNIFVATHSHFAHAGARCARHASSLGPTAPATYPAPRTFATSRTHCAARRCTYCAPLALYLCLHLSCIFSVIVVYAILYARSCSSRWILASCCRHPWHAASRGLLRGASLVCTRACSSCTRAAAPLPHAWDLTSVQDASLPSSLSLF